VTALTPTKQHQQGWPTDTHDLTSKWTGKPKTILWRLNTSTISSVGDESGRQPPGHKSKPLGSPSFDGFLKDAFDPLCSGGVIFAQNRDVRNYIQSEEEN